MIKAQKYVDHSHGAPSDYLTLTYEDRFLRRKLLHTDAAFDVLIDLPAVTSLDPGGVLVTEEGSEIGIKAAAEPLLEVTGDLKRFAWHIGNRHTPCQIEDTRLVIQRDKVIAKMLEHLGAKVREVEEPFTPEGGAYGHGRTHSHEHGHTHHV